MVNNFFVYKLTGPDTELTGIPHQLWVCTLSDALNGVGFAFRYIGDILSISKVFRLLLQSSSDS
jgi:hypothetical protein